MEVERGDGETACRGRDFKAGGGRCSAPSGRAARRESRRDRLPRFIQATVMDESSATVRTVSSHAIGNSEPASRSSESAMRTRSRG